MRWWFHQNLRKFTHLCIHIIFNSHFKINQPPHFQSTGCFSKNGLPLHSKSSVGGQV